jgi:hypothetical protein
MAALKRQATLNFEGNKLKEREIGVKLVIV